MQANTRTHQPEYSFGVRHSNYEYAAKSVFFIFHTLIHLSISSFFSVPVKRKSENLPLVLLLSENERSL